MPAPSPSSLPTKQYGPLGEPEDGGAEAPESGGPGVVLQGLTAEPTHLQEEGGDEISSTASSLGDDVGEGVRAASAVSPALRQDVVESLREVRAAPASRGCASGMGGQGTRVTGLRQ